MQIDYTYNKYEFFKKNDINLNSDETNINDIEHEYRYLKNTHYVIKCFPF
jgi:hypothetical protein